MYQQKIKRISQDKIDALFVSRLINYKKIDGGNVLTIEIKQDNKNAYFLWIKNLDKVVKTKDSYGIVLLDFFNFMNVEYKLQHKRSESFVKLLQLALMEGKNEINNPIFTKQSFNSLEIFFFINGKKFGIILANLNVIVNKYYLEYFKYSENGCKVIKVVVDRKEGSILGNIIYLLQNILNEGG